MERPDFFVNGLPGDQDADDIDEGGQQDQHQADAVQPQTEGGAENPQPGIILGQEPDAGGSRTVAAKSRNKSKLTRPSSRKVKAREVQRHQRG